MYDYELSGISKLSIFGVKRFTPGNLKNILRIAPAFPQTGDTIELNFVLNCYSERLVLKTWKKKRII